MAHLQMLGVTERMSAEVVEIWQGYLAGRCYRMSAEVAEIMYLKLGCLAGRYAEELKHTEEVHLAWKKAEGV